MIFLTTLISVVTIVTCNDIIVGKLEGKKIVDDDLSANPTLWQHDFNHTVQINDTGVISGINITDLRPEKDGQVSIIEGGVGSPSVTLELKSRGILRGYNFHVVIFSSDQGIPEAPLSRPAPGILPSQGEEAKVNTPKETAEEIPQDPIDSDDVSGKNEDANQPRKARESPKLDVTSSKPEISTQKDDVKSPLTQNKSTIEISGKPVPGILPAKEAEGQQKDDVNVTEIPQDFVNFESEPAKAKIVDSNKERKARHTPKLDAIEVKSHAATKNPEKSEEQKPTSSSVPDSKVKVLTPKELLESRAQENKSAENKKSSEISKERTRRQVEKNNKPTPKTDKTTLSEDKKDNKEDVNLTSDVHIKKNEQNPKGVHPPKDVVLNDEDDSVATSTDAIKTEITVEENNKSQESKIRQGRQIGGGNRTPTFELEEDEQPETITANKNGHEEVITPKTPSKPESDKKNDQDKNSRHARDVSTPKTDSSTQSPVKPVTEISDKSLDLNKNDATTPKVSPTPKPITKINDDDTNSSEEKADKQDKKQNGAPQSGKDLKPNEKQ